MSYNKPLPVPDADSRPFWDGCREHRLLIMRCTNCGHVRFPPTTYCSNCQSGDKEWIESAGRGKVFSWIVVRHPVPKDVYAGDVPYIVALVTLDEGVRMPTNLVNMAPEDVRADMEVQVGYRDVTPEISLPVFSPVAK